MRCEKENSSWYEDGYKYSIADIYADTTPSTMPTDGANIDGMSDDTRLAIGSTIYVIGTGALYMMKSDGAWVQQ